MITHMITHMTTHMMITIMITRTCRSTLSSRRRSFRWSQPQNPQPTASSSWDLQVDCVKSLYDIRVGSIRHLEITSPPYVYKTGSCIHMEITLKHRMLLVLHNVCYNLSSSFGFLFHLFLREYFYTMHKLKTCIPGIFIKWGKYNSCVSLYSSSSA